jgi:hypothetical protein
VEGEREEAGDQQGADDHCSCCRYGGEGVRELTMGRWGMPSPKFALEGKKTATSFVRAAAVCRRRRQSF